MTESISFRIDSGDLARLRERARSKRASINSLVSQVIDRYLKLYVYDHAFGFFSVNKKVLRLMIDQLDDDQIRAVADDVGATVHREIIMYLYGRVTAKTVLDFLDIFGYRFEAYRHSKAGMIHTVTIFHGVSLNFSKLYYKIVRDIHSLSRKDEHAG